MKWDWSKHLGMDFETSGFDPTYALQPWRIPQGKAWATSLVWAPPGAKTASGGIFPSRDQMVEMLTYAIERNLRIVGWNVVFDIMVLLGYGLEELAMKAKWLDGMLLWRHATIEPEYEFAGLKRKSYSLKSCVSELWPEHAGYEIGIDYHSEDPAELEKNHHYNIKDVVFTLKAAAHWWNQLNDQQQKNALIEAESIPLVARANFHGMLVDTLAARELQQHLIDVADAKLTQMAPLGMTEEIVRSSTKLAELMYDRWSMPVLKTTTAKISGKVSRSTDKEVLHELALGFGPYAPDPRAKAIRDYREALGNRTKFADALLDSAEYNEDGYTRPSAIIFSTYTGRMTYASSQGKNKDRRQTGWALHQGKKGKMYRNGVTAPPGFTLLEADAAGQEYRWMAIAATDPVMQQLCLPGEDPHSYMAASILSIDYADLSLRNKGGESAAEKQRKLGKVANLSLQYRTSARRLRVTARVDYNIPMELPEAEHIHRTYPRTYKKVPVYWNFQIATTKRTGYVETFAGRRVEVIGDWTGPLGWSMGSTAINARIQGTGADQKYLALAVLKSYLTSIGAHFAWDLHDGLYFYVPTDKVDQAAPAIKRLLDNLPYKKAWGFTPPIPMPWDVKVGGSWGTLREWRP